MESAPPSLPLIAALLAQGHHIALSPDEAVLLLAAGVLLIYFELNRPGSILPGAAGLIAVLLSIDVILYSHPRGPALLALCVAASVLLLHLRRGLRLPIVLVAALALAASLAFLVPGVAAPIAAGCGLLLGGGTLLLTRVARRARTNKGLD